MRYKHITNAIVMILVLLMITGCAGGYTSTSISTTTIQTSTTATTASQTTEEQPPEEFTIDWFIDVLWMNYISWPQRGTNIGDQIFMRTGATVNIITTATDTGEQLATMVASDSLPDVFSTDNGVLISQLADAGSLVSYQDLDAFSPGLVDELNPVVLNYFKHSDGNNYFYPRGVNINEYDGNNYTSNSPAYYPVMRSDILEQLGNPDVTTKEGFLEACRRAEDEIKQYNGYDLIGLQFTNPREVFDAMNQIFAVPFEDEQGNWQSAWYTPQAKEGLAFLNEAYRMGVLKENNFSDPYQTIQEKWTQGRVFGFIGIQMGFTTQIGALYDSDNSATYSAICLHNSAGDDPVLSNGKTYGGQFVCVSKNAERPDLVAKLLHYMNSPTGINEMRYGTLWDYNGDGSVVISDEFLAVPAAERKEKLGYSNIHHLFFQSDYIYGHVTRESLSLPRQLATNAYLISVPLKQYTFDAYLMMKADVTDPLNSAMSALSNRIGSFMSTAISELITANSEAEFNQKYDETLITLQEMDLDTLVAFDNVKFQRSKQIFGVEYFFPPYNK